MRKKIFILGATALAVLIVASVNLYLAKTNFVSSLNSLHLVNLQALTNEVSSVECRTSFMNSRSLGTNCNCMPGVFQDYPREEVYICKGIGGGACNPGSDLVYYRCDGSIESKTNGRSTAHCPIY